MHTSLCRNVANLPLDGIFDIQESSREVSRQEGQEFARKLQTLFVECSAKTKLGVQQAFDELVQQIIDTPSLWQKQAPTNVRLQPNAETQEYSGCAC